MKSSHSDGSVDEQSASLPGRFRRWDTKDLPFDAEWNGTRYGTKQVRPIFVEEADQIVVVTVYVYYF